MVIDDIYKLALQTHVILASCTKFNLKGRQFTSASELKPVAFVFGLGPNAGLSLEVGGVILEDVTVVICKLAHLPMTQFWCTNSTPMQTALTYANEVEAVPVSSSRFHTIKTLHISHTTIIHHHTLQQNTTQHYRLT